MQCLEISWLTDIVSELRILLSVSFSSVPLCLSPSNNAEACFSIGSPVCDYGREAFRSAIV